MKINKAKTRASQEDQAQRLALLKALPDTLIEVTGDGLILSYIPASNARPPFDSPPRAGGNLRDLFSPQIRSAILYAVQRAFESKEMQAFEFQLSEGSSMRGYEVRVSPSSKQAALLILRDVTFPKHLERERENLIHELEIKNEESETLRESLAGIVGSLEFSQIIENILDQIKRVVPYDSASIWQIEGSKQTYFAGRSVPADLVPGEFAIEIDNENSALPILKGEVPYALHLDVQNDLKDFQSPPHNYIHSWLGVPLKTRGQIIGLIALDGREKNQFTQHHAELAVTFANQVAIALDNSRLFTELQAELSERKQVEVNLRQRESILEVVAGAANSFLKSADWRAEIDMVLEKLGTTINASHAFVFENHELQDGNVVTSMRFEWSAQFVPSDLDDPTYQNIPVRESEFEAFYEMMINGQPYLGDSNHLNRDEMDILLDRGMKALLDVPIFVEGRWWGTIGFDEIKSARLWSNAEVGALLVAANVLGAAIQRQRTDAKLQEELTHRKQLIADLAAKNAELERFSYTVSHDLKSPLFTIRGFLGYLEQDALAGDQTRLRNDIQRIVGATDKMQQLLNDLLELSRIGRLVNEPRAINLNALISEVTVLLHGQLKESRAELRMNENLPEVYGDRQRISEVIQNLLDNAAKFMGDQPYPRIEIGEAGSEAGMPVLFVRDNGIGIQKEHIERVFGLFNKLDPQSEGTGIGLALVKRIVEIHGGRIWVESQPGSGSTFYFTLPSKPAPDSVL